MNENSPSQLTHSRRRFILNLMSLTGIALLSRCSIKLKPIDKRSGDPKAVIYRVINGSPAQNVTKIIEIMGGIEKLFGSEDIIVIKPNLQWWNQGSPNLAAVEKFISLIMEHPKGFQGEVVIAENNHRGPSPWEHGGWGTFFERNSGLEGVNNYNDLVKLLKKKYGDRFSVCYWVNMESGAKRVYSPHDGVGYVLCDGTNGVPLYSVDNGLTGEKKRETVMSYPIFKTDRGTIIDFKFGVWKDGIYTGQPYRFINCAALNHHSNYGGATSAVKNFMGVSDLSGGPDPYKGGKLTGDYYNFHTFPFNKWDHGPVPGMLGLEVGHFLSTIRKPYFNMVTADLVGMYSRTDLPVAQTRTLLFSKDPVALDYHSCKYILYPNSYMPLHNPDNGNGPLHQYLKACSENGGGIFNEEDVAIKSYDLVKQRFQDYDELIVQGEKVWGKKLKTVLKHYYLNIKARM